MPAIDEDARLGAARHRVPDGLPISIEHRVADRSRSHGSVSHAEHALVFLVDGSIRMLSHGTVEAATGSMLIVPSGVPHEGLGRSGELWAVGFSASSLRLDEGHGLMAPFKRVRLGAIPVVSIPPARRPWLLRLFEELHEQCERTSPEASELQRSLLILLLGELCAATPQPAREVAPGSLVAHVLTHIQQHALGKISLRTVAAAVHRTPAHVATALRCATGRTVGDWIRGYRVAEAAARLAHSDDSLDEIACHVGWNDKTHLIRQFRKVYGQTPAAWRRELRRAVVHGRSADARGRSADGQR